MNGFGELNITSVSGTSAECSVLGRSLRIIIVAGALTLGGTHSSFASPMEGYEDNKTNSGVSINHQQSAGAAILELRRLSGMTWDQLADLFDVSRRTVHFWASGKALNAGNEERLYRVLSILKQVDKGSAQLNREALFTSQTDGTLPIDLLRTGSYSDVARYLGEFETPRVTFTPISREERAARMPTVTAGVLANARQGSLHRAPERVRVARTVREDKKPSGDKT